MKTRILSLLLALCLIVGVLPFAAFAEAAPFVSVKLVRYVEQLIEQSVVLEMYVVPGETKYATTSDEGAIAEATETDAWNLKVEFPADGKPTLTLRGATLKSGKNEFPLSIEANVALTVVTEEDSDISTVNRAGIYVINSDVTTITGPGKLTVTSTDGSCMYMMGDANNALAGTLLIKDADLELAPSGDSSNRMAISFTGGDLTIDNSVINITAGPKTLGIWGYAKYTPDAETGTTQIASTWKTGEDDPVARNLIIQNGSEITGKVQGRHGFGASGTVMIKDSTVEMTATGKYPVFDKAPDLQGEYSAIGGGTEKSAKVYDAAKFGSTSAKYAKIVPGTVELIPTEPETQPTTVPETKPEATKPEATKPEATEPEATEPEATEPEATEPEATEPEATKPEATKPETTTPEATKPETTTPEATKPEATTPEATTPETQPTADDDTNAAPDYTLVAILVCGAALVAVVVAVVVVINSKKKAK